jgi:diguanylate cyclase (GGDEF)-like protein
VIDDLEEERLAALYRYQILDTPPEESFDRITRMVRTIIGTPIAAITLIDRDREFKKSRQGDTPVETPREATFCTHTVQQNEPMIVEDTNDDPRFRDHPSGVQFYLGVPLRTKDGFNIGSLCAIGLAPQRVLPGQVDAMRDLAAMVMEEFELRRLAQIDSLTGALTRGAFLGASRREAERVRRNGGSVSIVALDLDHFKRINDNHGHSAGDYALKTVIEILRDGLRATDIIGRTGGEEFVITLPNTALDGAMQVSERLRQTLAATPLQVGDRAVPLTASFGVAEWETNECNLEQTLMRADIALYAAKAQGRNRVVASNDSERPLRVAGVR